MDLAEFQQVLEGLRQDYKRQLPARIDEIEGHWRTLLGGEWQVDNFKTFLREVHSLAGSGATYGFVEVSEKARALELYLKSIGGEARVTEHECQEIETRLAELRATAQSPSSAPTAHPPAPAPSFEDAPLLPSVPGIESVPVAQTTPAFERAPLVERVAYPPDDSTLAQETDAASLVRRAFVLAPGSPLIQDLQTQLGYFGYVVEFFERVEELVSAIAANIPTVLIVDLDPPENSLTSSPAMNSLRALRQQYPVLPFVFLSRRDDLNVRLDAVRAGASAYLIKPISISSLVETLDSLTAGLSVEPYHILIVEDDVSVAQYVSAVLEQAGMLTRVVTDPFHVMPPLIEFRPDLILTDLHMPGVNGLELASIIRQQEAYLGIPIVFLSMESDPQLQLSAMRLGGDDFLKKPIEPDHLISSVTSRVQRARILRGLAERDSLTGLLNHTRLKEQLVIEITRADRRRAELAFAMLDIDHFKTVNDTFGHPTGDRVIKSLARLLKQRLRRTDIVGRYGGEEFAIILPETNGIAAYQVIDSIRSAFAQVQHYSDRHEFRVTCSAGLATFPRYPDAASVSQAADRALYQAKHNGRNQVVRVQ